MRVRFHPNKPSTIKLDTARDSWIQRGLRCFEVTSPASSEVYSAYTKKSEIKLNLFSPRLLRIVSVIFSSSLIFISSDFLVDYSAMVKHRSLEPRKDGSADVASEFLDTLRTRAMDDLRLAALEYGIILKDLTIIDRQFKGLDS